MTTTAFERTGAGGVGWARAAVRRAFAPARRRIEFVCDPDDRGVIAEPVPAKTVLPDWFRRLPAVDRSALSPTNNALTVKRCMPFLDAMTTGWIIPLAATVRLEVKDGGRTIEAGWEFDREMVSNHTPAQVRGNPREPRPPCKFHNYWTVLTPPGLSTLFVPPLNRGTPVFECVAGIVDTDRYSARIHFPFFATAPDGLYVIEKGTPLVQAIPFRRDGALEGVIRAEGVADEAARRRTSRAVAAGDGWYRTTARAPR